MRVDTHKSVDCDVHVVASIDELAPHLSEYWRDAVREFEFKQPPGLGYTYPPAFEMVATKATHTSLAAIQEALASAINCWLRTEWLDRDDRLLASAVVTPHVASAAVEEIERVAADPRFVQIVVPAAAEDHYGNHRYWPIWQAAAEHGLAVAIAFGGAALTPPTAAGWPSSFFEAYGSAHQAFQTHMISLIASGVFEEYPDLKITVVESGWTWLPPVLWRMDMSWKALRREAPWVKELPSEYVARHFRFTTQPTDAPDDTTQLTDVLEQLGMDNLLMFSSDYPHKYGSTGFELIELLQPEQAKRVLWSNAVEHYQLERRLALAGER